ncbi:hypothetical protein CTheo_3434 [Ceratobasidium theobromae]|uniref:Uncharacterized protein n=1 Tax=Ceratobasidium theobromae TaxID=1582974 RepID=A0A5N5QMW6_9AGAM|nr:hypothetical protein CTheo_3434 [Ceratobasidium theobromae]
MTASPTLYFDLTTPRSNLYPVTEVIYNLIQILGADVCSFRRNPQTSYRLVELARDLHDEINNLIEKVEESGDWEDYIKYTEAIDPLEQVLLDIVAVIHEEQEEYLVTGSSVQECTASIAKWVNNRKSIRDCFQRLQSESELKVLIPSAKDSNDEILNAYAHDDRGLLHSLLRGIEANLPLIKRQKIQSSLKSVRDGLESVLDLREGGSKRSIDEGLNTLSIKCGMITYGVTQLMLGESVIPSLRDHLHTEGVWKVAKELVEHTYDCLKSGGSTLAQLEAAYKVFESVLLKETPVELPKSYFRLVKMIGKIDRAYYAQSLLLLSLCREAASHFEEKKTLDVSDALEKQGVRWDYHSSRNGGQNGTQNGGPMSESEFSATEGVENDPIKLFEQSVDDLQVCFEAIGIDNMSDLRTRLDEAQRKDNDRMQLIKEKLRAAPTAIRELVNVTVKVHDGSRDGHKIAELTCNVPPHARVGYVKWNVVKQLPNPTMIETSHFEKALVDDSQPAAEVPVDTDIKSLATDNKCTLYMVIGAKGGANGTH